MALNCLMMNHDVLNMTVPYDSPIVKQFFQDDAVYEMSKGRSVGYISVLFTYGDIYIAMEDHFGFHDDVLGEIMSYISVRPVWNAAVVRNLFSLRSYPHVNEIFVTNMRLVVARSEGDVRVAGWEVVWKSSLNYLPMLRKLHITCRMLCHDDGLIVSEQLIRYSGKKRNRRN